MPLFIKENLSSIIALAAVLAVLCVVIVGMVRRRKRGEDSCSCGCASCPMGNTCHRKEKRDEE